MTCTALALALTLHFTSLTQIYILDRRECDHIVDNFSTERTGGARLALGLGTRIFTPNLRHMASLPSLATNE